MTKWRDEVEAAVDSIVDDVPAVQTALVPQESLVLVVDVLKNGTEAVRVVDCVTKSRRVHHRQPQLHSALLNLHCRCVELQRLLLFFFGIGHK
jgi:hypothetical protein